MDSCCFSDSLVKQYSFGYDAKAKWMLLQDTQKDNRGFDLVMGKSLIG